MKIQTRRQGIILSFVAMVMLLALPMDANAHGEDKLGPNGGEIRMPGAFHTEAKQDRGTLKIYLLDIQFQNPTVEKSSVDVRIRNGKSPKVLNCVTEKDYFKCELPKGEVLSKGELVVKANRAGAQGNEAVYKLPLLSKTKAAGSSPEIDHSGHGHQGH